MAKINKKFENGLNCPNCNDTDTYMIGMGEGFSAYYHCEYCGHNFTVDLSYLIDEEHIKEREELCDL